LDAVLSPPCARIRAAQVDTVVLGCTHYPFVVDAIRTQIGSDVQVVDTAAAVAERVAAVRDHDDMSSASLQVWSTGATESMTSLLQRCRALEQAGIGRLPI
jgi:glutamate racemase